MNDFLQVVRFVVMFLPAMFFMVGVPLLPVWFLAYASGIAQEFNGQIEQIFLTFIVIGISLILGACFRLYGEFMKQSVRFGVWLLTGSADN
jgi:hypothetical protein